MQLVDFIGSMAAPLTTISFIPQVWRIWQIRHTRDISHVVYIAFTSGVALWLVYGILLDPWPIIIANSITICLSGAVLIMKIRFG